MRVILDYQGDYIELPLGESVIGRDTSCRIRFNDPSVSRRHLRVTVNKNSAQVEELQATNGTLINGKRLKGVHIVEDGDEIQLGRRVFNVRLADGLTEPHIERDDETETNSGLHNRRTPIPHEVNTPPSGGSYSDLLSSGMAPPEFGETMCPRCRTRVAADLGTCPSCGYQWPLGRPKSVTQRIPFKHIKASERRREPRRAVEIPVFYTSDTLTFDAIARDLSSGGMYIAGELLDPIGTSCSITILADGGPAVCFSGLVCHAVDTEYGTGGRPPGLGIKFTKMGEGAEAWLQSILSRTQSAGDSAPSV